MVVNDIINRTVKTAHKSTSVKDIASMMCLNKISGVPVVDDENTLVGILSEKDILQAMFPDVTQAMEEGIRADFESIEADYRDIMHKNASDLMTHTVATVTPDMPLLKAVSLMCIKKIRRIPVTDINNKLLGIISIGDVHKALFKENLLEVN